MTTATKESTKSRNGEKQEVFMKAWADSYADVSKMWEDSYVNLQKPWLETTGELIEKAVEISQDATQEQYQEFFGEWEKAYRKNFGKTGPIPTVEADKDSLKKLMATAKDSVKLYKSWITALEENTKKTETLLKEEADPAAYKAMYDQWMKSYEKIFDELLALSSVESTREILEKYTGVPDMFLGSFVQISKLWRNSYSKLYEPWVDSISNLSMKAAEISRGGAAPQAYKDFYTLWVETYEETYGKVMQTQQPSQQLFESFTQGTDIYLNMYKSWINALEKMAEKSNELSRGSSDPEVSQELYSMWIKMYEKAFGSFFEDMPIGGPMKQMMGPVKTMVDIYTDTLAGMSRMWARSGSGFSGRS